LRCAVDMGDVAHPSNEERPAAKADQVEQEQQ
jgi:hypothetical protein